jgi:ribonuclease-3
MQEELNQKRETPHEFAKRLNLPFSDYRLLTRALTHRSYKNEHDDALEDNERLEFLGDAVLDFLVGAWLYNRYPELSEGKLTRLRSALVGTEQLANFARKINLGAAILLGRGEEENGGRQRPSLLCAGFEALVGALYLDAGLEAVERFIKPMLEYSAERILFSNRDKDPKSLLQEWAQSRGYGTPEYRVVSTSGPDHAKTFEVEVLIQGNRVGFGTGSSKHVATKNAASDALKSLELDVFE